MYTNLTQYKLKNKYNVNAFKFKFIILSMISSIILFMIGIIVWNNIMSYDEKTLNLLIYIYGWVGIIVFIYSIFSYKIFNGKIFSLYLIFLIFMMIFNYGQFAFWSLGIHYKGELGATNFIRYMDQFTILKIEIISSLSMMTFHIGALISMINNKKIKNKRDVELINHNVFCNVLRKVCTITLIISVPIAIYSSFISLKFALENGYTSLYYGEDIQINPIIKYITYLFFPSIIGFLVGNKFSKSSFIKVGIIFGVYMTLNLLAGDRGSWIYYILVLLWCYITYRKKISMKMIIKYTVISCIILISTSILVTFREIGFDKITLQDIQLILKDLPYIFIKPFFEMGQSARVLGIIIQDNIHETWQYGNTYLSAISAMFLPRMKIFLGFPDFYLDNWISQTYLGLTNYGVGFSIMAEAYLNGGILLCPLIMMIVGYFIGVITRCDSESINNPCKMFISISSTGILLSMIRASLELSLRKWAYGVLFILVVTQLLAMISSKNRYKSI